MTEIALSDGRLIVIRPMSAEDLFPAGGGRCPASRLTALGEDEPDRAAQCVLGTLTEAYGSVAILALDGRTVAGLLTFFPTWCRHVDLCSEAQIEDALGRLDEALNPAPMDDPALHVRCLAVHPDYRGHGLALAMLERLKGWARSYGWRTPVANGCIFSGRAAYQWRVAPKPPRPLWERAGFVVSDYPPLRLPAVSPPEAARGAFDWFLSDAFPGFLERDVPRDAPDWREIFADYTMVCRL
ncbi:MAG: GNAT family N-acetyltransferase [Anaerolineae bacterium]|nr:GNAT family N-acetyltransferase [Anaerolineae bacterium]